jgi:predicted ATPase
MTIADRQGAQSWKLRAACSLSELLSRTDRRSEAVDLVASLHDSFTEGHDTADLARARLLLDEVLV